MDAKRILYGAAVLILLASLVCATIYVKGTIWYPKLSPVNYTLEANRTLGYIHITDRSFLSTLNFTTWQGQGNITVDTWSSIYANFTPTAAGNMTVCNFSMSFNYTAWQGDTNLTSSLEPPCVTFNWTSAVLTTVNTTTYATTTTTTTTSTTTTTTTTTTSSSTSTSSSSTTTTSSSTTTTAPSGGGGPGGGGTTTTTIPPAPTTTIPVPEIVEQLLGPEDGKDFMEFTGATIWVSPRDGRIALKAWMLLIALPLIIIILAARKRQKRKHGEHSTISVDRSKLMRFALMAAVAFVILVVGWYRGWWSGIWGYMVKPMWESKSLFMGMHPVIYNWMWVLGVPFLIWRMVKSGGRRG